MNLPDLLRDPPRPHRDGEVVFGLGEDVLQFLDGYLEPGMRTLETGCGLSTILFAVRGAIHTCIVPSAEQVEVLRSWCAAREVDLGGVSFLLQPSQDVLPGLVSTMPPLDLLLVDGGHGFPIPAIDWYYGARMLRTGGLAIIDDVDLWTGLELRQFLSSDPAWASHKFFYRAASFRKISDRIDREWNEQPYVARRSRLPVWSTRVRNAWAMIRGGRWTELRRKLGLA